MSECCADLLREIADEIETVEQRLKDESDTSAMLAYRTGLMGCVDRLRSRAEELTDGVSGLREDSNE